VQDAVPANGATSPFPQAPAIPQALPAPVPMAPPESESWAFEDSDRAPTGPVPQAPRDLPLPPAQAWDSWYARPAPPPSGPPAALPPPPGYPTAVDNVITGRPVPRDSDPFVTRPDGMPSLHHGSVPGATRALMRPGALDRLRPASRQSGSGGRRRIPVPLIIGVAAAAALVAAGVYMFHGTSPGPASSNQPPANTKSRAPGGSGSTAERQAAVALAGLLAQSVGDRGAVNDAVVSVHSCGPQLAQDARTFFHAAQSRRRMMAKLRELPGSSALPATMMQDLTGAWQASASADSDLGKWAKSAMTHGCNPKTVGSSAYLRESYVPDGTASSDKQAFASQWDPIARRYNLTPYQSDLL
jgi:hypothetical protein